MLDQLQRVVQEFHSFARCPNDSRRSYKVRQAWRYFKQETRMPLASPHMNYALPPEVLAAQVCGGGTMKIKSQLGAAFVLLLLASLSFSQSRRPQTTQKPEPSPPPQQQPARTSPQQPAEQRRARGGDLPRDLLPAFRRRGCLLRHAQIWRHAPRNDVRRQRRKTPAQGGAYIRCLPHPLRNHI